MNKQRMKTAAFVFILLSDSLTEAVPFRKPYPGVKGIIRGFRQVEKQLKGSQPDSLDTGHQWSSSDFRSWRTALITKGIGVLE
jgi:hypothetical protein